MDAKRGTSALLNFQLESVGLWSRTDDRATAKVIVVLFSQGVSNIRCFLRLARISF